MSKPTLEELDLSQFKVLKGGLKDLLSVKPGSTVLMGWKVWMDPLMPRELNGALDTKARPEGFFTSGIVARFNGGDVYTDAYRSRQDQILDKDTILVREPEPV